MKKVKEIYGYLLLESGKEISLDGSFLPNLDGEVISQYWEGKEFDEEANIYVKFEGGEERILNTLESVKNFFGELSKS